jgi:hypothetical protein
MTGNRRLLREFYQVQTGANLVKESRDKNGGKLYLSGTIQRADKKNQNGRIYPRKLLTREFENYMKAVRESRATGELDHPEESTVSLGKISHVLREMWWDGDDMMGRIEILGTPSGKIAETIIEAGVPLGISSRGVGSTSKNESGDDFVQEDFNLICFDLVADPSTHGAYMLPESRLIESSSRLVTRPDRIFRAVNAIVMDRK